MNSGLRTAASVQLVGLTWLGIYDWGTIPELEWIRWPVSGLIWLSAFLWLLRSPTLPTLMMAPPLAALGLWSMWYLIAVNWSSDARPSLAFSLGMFSTVLAGSWFVATFGWDLFAKILTVTIAAFLVAGLVYASFGSFFNENGRFFGLGNNPTDTGRHAAMMVVLSLSAFRDQRRVRLAFLIGGLAFTALAIAKTALAGLVIVAVFLVVRRAGPIGRSALASIGAVALVAAAALALARADAWLTVSDEPNVATPLTLTGRTGIWNLAWDVILQRPLFGHGTGSSFIIYGELISDGRLAWKVTNSHNLWLHSAVEHGAIGLACLVVAAITIVRGARRYRDPNRDAVLVLVGVSSLTEALMQFPSLVVLIVAGAAAAVSTGNGAGDDEAATPPGDTDVVSPTPPMAATVKS